MQYICNICCHSCPSINAIECNLPYFYARRQLCLQFHGRVKSLSKKLVDLDIFQCLLCCLQLLHCTSFPSSQAVKSHLQPQLMTSPQPPCSIQQSLPLQQLPLKHHSRRHQCGTHGSRRRQICHCHAFQRMTLAADVGRPQSMPMVVLRTLAEGLVVLATTHKWGLPGHSYLCLSSRHCLLLGQLVGSCYYCQMVGGQGGDQALLYG